MVLSDIRSKRGAIMDLAQRYGARNIRVFGSVTTGQSLTPNDVDFLIELEEGRSLLDRIAMKQDLEDLLGQSVDLVTEKGLHWFIRDQVLSEAVPL